MLPALAIALSTLALSGAQPASEGPAEYAIPRTDAQLVIDGRVDEAAWDDALVLELGIETDPGENVAAPVRTVCRLLYSRTHLYYGCTAYDPHPEEIRARYTDRDRATDDDTIGIAVDPFDSQNRSYVLDVNPLGVQNDRLYTEADGRSDPSWDTFWESAGRITEEGFEVEAAVPFSSLSFPRRSGKQRWGFSLRRYYPREFRYRLAVTPYRREDACRACQNPKLVGFEGIDAGRNLKVTPTLTGLQSAERDSFPNGELERGDPDLDPGLTVKWGMTPNLTLAGTLNPDFSQVEADVAQLDINNQFALFFPERRPFFLEGSDVFATPIRVVYTRSIADPTWGLKVTGKEGKHALGVFTARDEVTNLLLPGPESSSVSVRDREADTAVLRYRRDLGTASTVGALYTDRSGGGYLNRLAGIDTRLRLDEANTLTAQVLGSRTRYASETLEETGAPPGTLEDFALFADYRHRRRSWSAGATYQEVGDDFRADLGFLPKVGYRELGAEGEFHWFGDADHWFERLQVGVEVEREERIDGDLLSEGYKLGFNYRGPMQSFAAASWEQQERSYLGQRFDLGIFGLHSFARPTGDLEVGLAAIVGDGIDFTNVQPADRLELYPSIGYRFGRHLDGSLSHQFRQLDVAGGRLFEANLTELRIVYQWNVRTFVRAILQYTDVTRDPSLYSGEVAPEVSDLFGQLLFSYKLNPETAIFVGYTGAYLDLDASGLVETGNTVFFKLSYNWQP